MILTVVIFTVDLENNHKKARLTNLEYLALSLSRKIILELRMTH